jgi:hypothetical protein
MPADHSDMSGRMAEIVKFKDETEERDFVWGEVNVKIYNKEGFEQME